MIELLVRHLVVLALAGICSLALRRRSAALRHALWTVALALCVLLPVLPSVPISLPAPTTSPAPIEREVSRANIPGYAVALDAPTAPAPLAPAPTFPWATLAWGVYLAVALGLVLRWTIGWGLAARLARRGKRLGAARGVPVVAVEGVGPLTFGWPRGVIVVPHAEFALDKLVLRHEVAHVKRGDFVWQGIGALACALWWFSPAVWLAARALRREAERACDDLVLSQGVSAPDYADCLLEVASMKPLSLPFAASLVPLARRNELSQRIAALLAPNRDRRSARPLAVVGLTALLLPAGLSVSRPVLADGTGAAESPVAASLRSAVRALPRLKAPVMPPLTPSLPLPKAPSTPSPFSVAIPTPPASELSPAASADAPSRVARVAPVSSAPHAVEPPAPASAATAVPAAPETPSLLKGKKIVLDPGHGGNDRGASSGYRAMEIQLGGRVPIIRVDEKNINLAIAERAAALLRKEGAIVTLTRDGDSFVDLNKRAAFSAGQDLFLSIHVDSGEIPTNSPFRVMFWYHGEKGGSVPDEVKKLALATGATIGGASYSLRKALPSPTPPPAPPKPITTPNQREAQRLHEFNIDIKIPDVELADALVTRVAPDGQIASSGLAVLRNAKCPAFLIDFGNIKHERDLAKLRDPAFLDKIATGLVAGAKAVFTASPARSVEPIITERIPIRFLSAEEFNKLIIPIIGTLNLRNVSYFAEEKGNYIVVEGTVGSIAVLKQKIALVDTASSVSVKDAKLSERILLRFMDADSLAKQLQPVIAKGGALSGVSVQPNPKDNSLVVQGTPEAVANLKQVVRILDKKPRVFEFKIVEVMEGKPGESFVISTVQNRKGELTVGSKSFAVVPHGNGDNTMSFLLSAGSEKPFRQRIPMGQETRIEAPFGTFLVTVTEVTDGANDPK